MLFNSFAFAVFLPIVFALYWLAPQRFRWLVLLLSSYWFYMSWHPAYIFLLLFTTVVSYAAARLIAASAAPAVRKLLLSGALLASLCVLFVFKYFNFFSASVCHVLGLLGLEAEPLLLHVLLPVGISFYTFQTMSYVMDVYRGRVSAERHLGKYAAFVSFFPQLVAGPIERTERLLPQLKTPRRFDYGQAVLGLRLMLWGFFKKMVVADGLAVYADKVFDDVYSYTGLALFAAAFCFTIQIYCDFSGYSDIAIGCARLFGIELMQNFRSPYLSRSIREFWSRWHISLSTWFRDYVYIPLGGNRVSAARHKWNLLVTFLVSGLWHGASWTFVIWGGLHGLAQVIETLLPRRSRSSRAAQIIRGCLVFIFVSLAWVFFRAQTLQEAIYVLSHMLDGISNPVSYLTAGYRALDPGKVNVLCICLQLLLLFLYDLISMKRDIPTMLGSLKKPVRWTVYVVIILLIAVWTPITSGTEFIYFQF